VFSANCSSIQIYRGVATIKYYVIIIQKSKKNRQHNGQKIPKRQSESTHQRRTDNTMAKRRSTKEQTTIYKTYIYNKDGITRTPLKTGVSSGAPEG
jgi:hypothetical protein